MLAPVLLGALLSAAVTLPLALPLAATRARPGAAGAAGRGAAGHPLPAGGARWPACCSAPEVSLLGLLEVVFGVLWVWLGTDEAPSMAVLGGGALVLGALAANEALALRRVARAT